MKNSSSPSPQNAPGGAGLHTAAFSLLELLVIIGIIGLLTALAVPAVSSTQKAFNLSKAAGLVQDYLQLARQMAITRNASVTLYLCKTADEFGDKNVNALALVRFDKNGTPEFIDRVAKFPPGYSITEDPVWSSMLNQPTTTLSLPSGEVDAYPIRYTPSGAATMDSSQKNFLTIYNHKNSEVPEHNFITLAIDPATGRVFTYQP